MLEVDCMSASLMEGTIKVKATMLLVKEVNSPNNIQEETCAFCFWSHKGFWRMFTYRKGHWKK